MGLPLEDIEALGCINYLAARVRLMTALGVTESETYAADVRIGGPHGTLPIVIVTPIPLIGYEVLENLRMKVNPVTQSVRKGAGGRDYASVYAVNRF